MNNFDNFNQQWKSCPEREVSEWMEKNGRVYRLNKGVFNKFKRYRNFLLLISSSIGWHRGMHLSAVIISWKPPWDGVGVDEDALDEVVEEESVDVEVEWTEELWSCKYSILHCWIASCRIASTAMIVQRIEINSTICHWWDGKKERIETTIEIARAKNLCFSCWLKKNLKGDDDNFGEKEIWLCWFFRISSKAISKLGTGSGGGECNCVRSRE